MNKDILKVTIIMLSLHTTFHNCVDEVLNPYGIKVNNIEFVILVQLQILWNENFS
jgi:hypothetical protein